MTSPDTEALLVAARERQTVEGVTLYDRTLIRELATTIAEQAKEIERQARNIEMWKGQVERQSAELTRLHGVERQLAEARAERDNWKSQCLKADFDHGELGRLTDRYKARVEAAEKEMERVKKEYPDPRHFNILVEAMAEVKATSDGLSDQPIADIVAGCIEEISALGERP